MYGKTVIIYLILLKSSLKLQNLHTWIILWSMSCFELVVYDLKF